MYAHTTGVSVEASDAERYFRTWETPQWFDTFEIIFFLQVSLQESNVPPMDTRTTVWEPMNGLNMKSCKASRLMDRDDGRWWQIIKLTKLNFSLCSNAENQNLDSFWSRTEWILEVVSLTLSLLVSLQVCHCSGKSFCHCDGVKGQQVRQSWPEQQVFTVSAANLGTDAWEAKLGQTGSHRVLDCSDFTDPGPAWVYSLLPSSGDPLSLQTHVTPPGADLDVDLM